MNPQLLLILGGATAFYFLVKSSKNSSGSLLKFSEKEINKDELSYDNSVYSSMADRLYIAMDGSGTNERTVREVIEKIQTPSDWKKLVTTFGVRETTSMFSDFSGNLYEWLEDEIDGSDMDYVKSKLESIGTTY